MSLIGFAGGVEIVTLFGIAMIGLVVYLVSREKAETENSQEQDNSQEIESA